jgi:uncharacterized protein with HEPN domain
MLPPDDTARIQHIIDAIRAVQRWTAGRDWVGFAADDELQAAVTYQIQVIGEATSRLSQAFRAANPQIPWSDIIRMRHILVHDYMRVDIAIVWQVAATDLPPLLTELTKLLPAGC